MLDSAEETALNYLKTMRITDNDINILLMGETGVGKSTFINAFANYMKYNKFNVAERSEVLCLIPAKFDVTDENFEVRTVQIGKHANESEEVGASATQRTTSYVFPIGKNKTRIRLIDTPGVGDTRGLTQDNINFEDILNYVGKLDRLHAVCFLLKPNHARLTVLFKYCIKQLLSMLERSASQNVVFLFTNTRNTFYRPGDTVAALKKILQEINESSNVDIQFGKDNVFCLDNEAFRFMVSCKNDISFCKEDRESFSTSWDQSVSECWRMIKYVTGRNDNARLSPHLVFRTVSTNQARNVIVQLSKPLSDIADLITDNITLLQRHKGQLDKEQAFVNGLSDRLYIPQVDLELIPLKHPITVCTNSKCCEVYTVEGLKKTHYKQVCHDRCYLEGVPQDLIGPPALVNCYAIDHPSKLCCECACDFSSHMHVYYLTKTFENKIKNSGVLSQIGDGERALEERKAMMKKVEDLQREYEAERGVIMKCTAKFAVYLKQNAIVTYNDAYQDYITYLIDREKSRGSGPDQKTISHYQSLMKQYLSEKAILDEALSVRPDDTSTPVGMITSNDILDSVGSLFSLRRTGEKIRTLHLQEYKLRNEEAGRNKEYVLEDLIGEADEDLGNEVSASGGRRAASDEVNAQGDSDSKFGQLLKWYFEKKFKN